MDPDAGPADETTEPYPWEVGHASPGDQAMGLELELIELEHTRDAAEDVGDPVEPIDEEISEVIEELIEAVPEPGEGDHRVAIDAPEAVELVDEGGAVGA